MSVRLRALSRSNDTACEAAAADELARGGTAIGAVLAGYFAAAGAYPGVLLGSISLLLGGVGSGERAFDGRVRQPGRNAKRPRGVPEGAEPPQAARVGVPCSVPALAVALSYGAGSGLARLVQPGVALATEQGATRRAAVLKRVGQVGALALAEPELSLALVRAFGPPSGGMLTPADFGAPQAIDLPALELEPGSRKVLGVPWAAVAEQAFVRGVGVIAIDINGLSAAAVFETQPAASYVEELELSAPLCAVPTLRGVPRVSPGAPLPVAAPIWLVHDASGTVELWCAPDATQPSEPGARSMGLRRAAGARTIEPVGG